MTSNTAYFQLLLQDYCNIISDFDIYTWLGYSSNLLYCPIEKPEYKDGTIVPSELLWTDHADC